MSTATFVHLSDIHFGAGGPDVEKRNALRRLNLEDDLRAMRARTGDALAVLVTGDIAFSGADDEFDDAREWLDKVAQIVGSDPSQVLVVPGNHDVEIGSAGRTEKLAHEALRICDLDDIDRELSDLLNDPARPLHRKLDNYNKFAVAYKCEVPDSGHPWEVPVPLGAGYELVLVGVTSVFNSDLRDEEGSLVWGSNQSMLPSKPGTVYGMLAHHGPDDCRDKQSIRNHLRGRASFVLSGHRHEQQVHTVNDCLELTAGAVHPEEQAGWDPTYNWITVHVPTPGDRELQIEVWPRRWDPAFNAYTSRARVGDSDRYPVVLGAPAPSSSAQVSPAQISVDEQSTDPAGSETLPAPAPLSDQPFEGYELNTVHRGSRPPLETASGEVGPERRAARALLGQTPPVQYKVLDALGVLEPDDWTKEYLDMIADALEEVSRLGRHDDLLELIERETGQRNEGSRDA